MASLCHSHQEQLAASMILPELGRQRGYCTITEPSALLDRGFSSTQSFMVPALAIPLWTVSGEQIGWQIRPDHPRTGTNGKLRRYEMPRRSRLTLDIHPAVQPFISDPSTPLWITEGVKKGDALASQGCCAIALMGGVWGFRGTNAQGGKAILPDWGHVALNDREVYIAYDNDIMRKPQVRSALETLVGFLQHHKARAHLVFLPDHEEKMGVDDFLAQGHTLMELMACVVERMPAPDHAATLRAGLPLLTQNPHELPALIEQSLAALMAMPGAPLLFQRARRLVTVVPPEPQTEGLRRIGGSSIIQAISGSRLRKLLAEAANWQTPNQALTKAFPDKPAMWLVDTLIEQESWPVPPLTGLLLTPTMRPDGTLLTTPGYDAHTGLWLAHHNVVFPQVSDTPTEGETAQALQFIREPLRDFPFAHPWHESAALAAILSLVARYAVENVPLFAIRATTRASGKTLLADVISLIAAGRLAPKIPQVREEEEERKRLLAIALDGDPLIVIDNVVGELGSPALDLAITSRSFKDRLLGKNTTQEAPLYAVFMATGNNMLFRGDMARRVIPIDLAPMEEHPETRADFQHPDLLTWVAVHRPALVCAALTILRRFHVLGRPAQALDAYGSFESWSTLIRSCLVWCGMADPCIGREGLEETSDSTFDAHAELLSAWSAIYTKPVLLRTILQDIGLYVVAHGHTNGTSPTAIGMESYERLKEALGAFDSHFDRGGLHMGPINSSLKRLTGRVIQGKRLMRGNIRGMYGYTWEVQSIPARLHESPMPVMEEALSF